MCLWESRNGNLSLGGAQILCKIFQSEGIRCNLEWLLSGSSTPPESRSAILEGPFLDSKPQFARALKNRLSWQVLDNSMEPLYEENELIFFQEINRREICSHEAYLTVDSKQIKRFTMVSALGNSYVLYNSRPEETLEVLVVKAFRPVAVCI